MLFKRFLLPQTRSIAHQPARTFPAYAHPRILNVARTFATPATMSDSVTLPVLDASELKDGEMKQVEFGEGEKKGKVLLVKIGGEVYANSGVCTHYGAPLAKGVLDSTGRITCPWHGACFNACTGDVEDAPGLDGLHTYTTSISNGKIHVTAKMSTILSKTGRSPIARAKVKKSGKAENGEKESSITGPDHDTSGERVVIIGGGSAGIHTIEALREHNFEGKITLISKEAYPPIDRTKISKALVADSQKLAWRSSEALTNDFGVELKLSEEVVSVDDKAKKVKTKSGLEVAYDKLIVAPGGKPKKLPIDGADLEGIVTVRGVEDAEAILAVINENARVAIIGTSFIGMETAQAIAGKKPKSVDIIGMDPYPFGAILGEDIGKALQKNSEKAGVKFHMNAGVEKILPSDNNSNKVGYVALKDSDPIPCDLLIMGVGVGPNTAFLKDSGFDLEKDGGLAVDEYLRVEGKEDIFALGDVAHYPQYPGKEKRRVEHWNVAGNHGRAVAESIVAPSKLKPYTKVPIFWSSAGGGLRYVSAANGFEDVHIDGDLTKDELKFIAYYAKGDEIVAVASVKSDPYVSKAAELLRLKQMPSFAEIKGGKNILDIDISGKSGN